jgi:hypothetical protein
LFFVKRCENGMRKAHEIQAQREPQQDDMHARDYSTWFAVAPVCDNSGRF